MLYAGLALGGLFIAPLVDNFGKKVPLLISLCFLMFIYIGIIFAKDYSQVQWYILAYGVDLAVIIVSGILLLLGAMPIENWPGTILAILISVACVGAYITIYFYFMSNMWKPLMFVGIGVTVIVIFCVLLMMESLRFLYDKERYDEL